MRPRVEVVAITGTEPVTLATLKPHLRVTSAQENTYLTGLCKTARIKTESFTGRSIIKKTLRMWLDRPPGGSDEWFEGTQQRSIGSLKGGKNYVELLQSPVQTVDAVTAYSDTDVPTVANASTYFLDNVDKNMLNRVALRTGQIWPIAIRQTNGFSIDYTAGYNDGAVPDDLLHGMNMLAAWLFTHRGDYSDAKAIKDSDAYDFVQEYRYARVSA